MKKLFGFVSAVLLLAGLLVLPPAASAAAVGRVRDDSELLTEQQLSAIDAQLSALLERHAAEVRLDVVTTLSGYDLESYARLYHDSANWGSAENHLQAMLYLQPQEDGFAYGGFTVLMEGSASQQVRETLESELCSYFENAGSLLLTGSGEMLAMALDLQLNGFCLYLDTALATQLAGGEASGGYAGDFVEDGAFLLDSGELARLNSRAQETALLHNTGVYVITVPDMAELGYYDSFQCAEALYFEKGLGMGTWQDGVLLFLSMAERDYALVVVGDANNVFDDYAQVRLEGAFLDDFADDRWYDGFADYYDTAADILENPPADTPFYPSYDDDWEPAVHTGPPVGMLLLTMLVIPCGVSLVICLVLRGQLKTAKPARQAEDYVLPNGVRITQQWDRFTHRTQSRTRVQSSSSSGGGRSGGRSGGSRVSGRSGKF